MPHPVPIVVGATLAVIGSGYAFKKFVYDPHLAPLIEALIAQHQANRRQRVGYETISTPVPVPAQQRQTPQPSSGRSTALAQRSPRHRRPAEMYELDDTRVVMDEKAFIQPPPRPRCPDGRARGYRNDHQQSSSSSAGSGGAGGPGGASGGSNSGDDNAPLARKPSRPSPLPPSSSPSPPPMAQPVPHRVTHVHPIEFINIRTSVPSIAAEAAEETPKATRHTNALMLDPETATATATSAAGSSLVGCFDSPALIDRDDAEPRRSSYSTVILDPSAATSPGVVASSYASSPVPSSLMSSPAKRPSSAIAMVSSPTFGTISSPSVAPSVSDDLEVISVSGTTTSYVDAERYTPRSPMSPSTPLSRAMSPPVHVNVPALAIPALSLENLSVLSMPAPPVATAPSVSSWGEDDHWRSDSEWDQLSDAGAL